MLRHLLIDGFEMKQDWVIQGTLLAEIFGESCSNLCVAGRLGEFDGVHAEFSFALLLAEAVYTYQGSPNHSIDPLSTV
jgi:hypothetical protein